MALHRQSGTTGEGVRILQLSSKADSLAEHVSLAGTLLGGGYPSAANSSGLACFR